MDKIEKLILPATILIASVVLGGFYYASQTSKTHTSELQRLIDEEATAEKAEQNTIALDVCMDEAEERRGKDIDYWLDYGSGCKGSLVIECLDWASERVAEVKANAVVEKNYCLERYSQ